MTQQLLLQKHPVALQTRMRREIVNEINRELSADGATQLVKDYCKKFGSAIHRPTTGPCKTYNCHGLTFGSRRTWISSAEISKILEDDDYIKVNNDKILPGDIAIYVKDGDFEHSGIVVAIEKGTPLILGKWGECHEVIHRVLDCPYNSCNVVYYRVVR